MSRLTPDGTAEPVSRDQILRHARGQGNIHFPCPADHEQDWQPYPVDTLLYVMTMHTYILWIPLPPPKKNGRNRHKNLELSRAPFFIHPPLPLTWPREDPFLQKKTPAPGETQKNRQAFGGSRPSIGQSAPWCGGRSVNEGWGYSRLRLPFSLLSEEVSSQLTEAGRKLPQLLSFLCLINHFS